MVSGIPEGLFFDLVGSEEVPVAYEIETAGARNRTPNQSTLCLSLQFTAFPPEEAASLEILKL